MSWRVFTESDLLTRMSGDELAAIRAAVLGPGQGDPVYATITQIVNQARGRIAACHQNQLGPVYTVPEELIDDVAVLVMAALSSRAGGTLVDSDKVRKEAIAVAEAHLTAIGKCEIAIEQPATVSSQVMTGAGGAEIVTSQARRADRCKLDGL